MRVYVAGAYSADNVIAVLNNMREGMRLSTQVMLCGHSPFSPWLDYQFQFMLRNGERLTVEDYYRYSIDWLRVSEQMVLVPGWENSKGTKAEIAEANRLEIPIFTDSQWLAWAHGNGNFDRVKAEYTPEYHPMILRMD